MHLLHSQHLTPFTDFLDLASELIPSLYELLSLDFKSSLLLFVFLQFVLFFMYYLSLLSPTLLRRSLSKFW